MKPGDKVWVFDATHQKIVSIKVIQGGENVVAAGKFPGDIGLFRPGFDCFPPARRCVNITGRYLNRIL